jgi:hypothetical protein
MEENAHLGGYNDVPMIAYDFQAPYGEYGQRHPVLDTIRPYHLFLQSFGTRLAPMTVYAPQMEPASRADFTTPRFAVRAQGDSGFVFLSNYVRQYPMAPQKDVQFQLALPSGAVTFPSRPVTIPTGAYFIWPFNFDLDGVKLSWATAQPLTRIETGPSEATYVFVAQDGVAPELAVAAPSGVRVSGSSVTRSNGLALVRPEPSQEVAAVVRANGKTIRLLVVSQAEAKKLWVGKVAGRTRLVETDNEVSFGDEGLELRAVGDPNFRVGFYPALDKAPQADLALSRAKAGGGVFQVFAAKAPAKILTATLTKVRQEGAAAPIVIGGIANRAVQPYPESFGRSAAWSITAPKDALDGVADVFLDIDYQGDVGRLFSGETMIDDDFWFGETWRVGLKRFKSQLGKPLTLTVLPLRKDAPIYLDDAVKAQLPPGAQVANVKSVTLVPQYRLELRF